MRDSPKAERSGNGMAMKTMKNFHIRNHGMQSLNHGLSLRLFTSGQFDTRAYVGFSTLSHRMMPETTLNRSYQFTIRNQLNAVRQEGTKVVQVQNHIRNHLSAFEDSRRTYIRHMHESNQTYLAWKTLLLSQMSRKKSGTPATEHASGSSRDSFVESRSHDHTDHERFWFATQERLIHRFRETQALQQVIAQSTVWKSDNFAAPSFPVLPGDVRETVNRNCEKRILLERWMHREWNIPFRDQSLYSSKINERTPYGSEADAVGSFLWNPRLASSKPSDIFTLRIQQTLRFWHSIQSPKSRSIYRKLLSPGGTVGSRFTTSAPQNTTESISKLLGLSIHAGNVSTMASSVFPLLILAESTEGSSVSTEFWNFSGANRPKQVIQRFLTQFIPGPTDARSSRESFGNTRLNRLKTLQERTVRTVARKELTRAVRMGERKLTLRLISTMMKRLRDYGLFQKTPRKSRYGSGNAVFQKTPGVAPTAPVFSTPWIRYSEQKDVLENPLNLGATVNHEITRVQTVFRKETETRLKELVTGFVQNRRFALNNQLFRQLQSSNVIGTETHQYFSEVSRNEFAINNPFRNYNVNTFMDYINLNRNDTVDSGPTFYNRMNRNELRVQKEAEIHQTLSQSKTLYQLRKLFEQNIVRYYNQRFVEPYSRITQVLRTVGSRMRFGNRRAAETAGASTGYRNMEYPWSPLEWVAAGGIPAESDGGLRMIQNSQTLKMLQNRWFQQPMNRIQSLNPARATTLQYVESPAERMLPVLEQRFLRTTQELHHHTTSFSEEGYSTPQSLVHRSEPESAESQMKVLQSATEKRLDVLAGDLEGIKNQPQTPVNMDRLADVLLKRLDQRMKTERQRRGII